jgi:outer membrane receptor protein involved in Fe transport
LPYNPNVNWPNAYGNTAAFATGAPDPLFESGVGYTYTRTAMTALEADYDLARGLTLTSVSGWTNLKTADVGTYDQPPPLGVATLFTQHAISEELRLTSDWRQSWINFTAGGLYNADSAQDYTVINVPIATYYTNSKARVDTKVWSGFGQVLLTPIDKWEFAAGARYTSVRKQLPFLDYGGDTAIFYPPNVGLVGDVVPYLPASETRYSETNTSPEVTLTYRPNEQWTDYVAFKKGYRGPGLNTDESAATFSSATEGFFRGETVKGGEGGIKATLLDHRLSLTADLYRYEYNNLQVAYVSGTNFTVIVENGADARTQGAEFAAAFSPANVEGLTLNAATNYNASKYTYFPGAPCYAGETAAAGCMYPPGLTAGGHQNNAGRALPHAPRATGRVGGNYKFDFSADYSLSFSGNVNFSSRYEADPYYNPFGYQAGYATLDAAIHLSRRNDWWDLALIGRDLNNRYIVSSGLEEGTTKGPGQTGDVIDYVERPREVWLQLTVHPKL